MKASRPLLVAVLCAGALGTGALLLSRQGPPAPPGGAAVDAGVRPAGPGTPAAASAAFAPDAYDPALLDPGGAEEADGGRVPLPLDPEAVAEGPLVLVMRGEPPVPAAGVEVAWIERGRARERLAQEPAAVQGQVHHLDLPGRFGQRARTDAQGRLRLPPLRDHAIVTAADPAENLFAAATTRPGRGEVRLLLLPDEEVGIEVADGAGRPGAGVPVLIGQRRGRRDPDVIWRGATDAQGRAVARHFQMLRRDARERDQREGAGERFAAALAVPLAEPVAAPFDGRPAPAEPLRLVLPPVTSLELLVAHASGPAVLSACGVALTVPRAADLGEPALGRSFDQVRLDKPVGEAPLVLDRVGLSLELEPVLRFPGIRGREALPPLRISGSGAGGDAGSGPVAARLVLPPDLTVVAGRLVRDGVPLGGMPVAFAVATADATVLEGQTTTLADGRFDFVCKPGEGAAEHVLALRWAGMQVRWGNPDAPPPHGVELRVPALRAGERRDLGFVELLPLPLLAAGRVGDDRGEPVEGAQVEAQRRVETRRGERWIDLPGLDTRTAPDGSWALHGATVLGPVRIAASRRGHFGAESGPVAPGATVDLRLLREAQIGGRVLLPGWLPRGAADAHLEPVADGGRGEAAAIGRNGAFRFDDLREGVYVFEVRVRNLPAPLCRLGGVAIAPGDNADPRLESVDLRDALHRYELRAIGAGGRLLASFDGPILWRTGPPEARQDVAFRWQKGRAEILTAAPWLELVALAQGYAATPITVGPGQHDVYFQELHPAVVDLPGVRALAGMERAIRVSMIFQGDTGLPQGIGGVDQRTGQRYSFPRWHLGKSGGGWLDLHDRAHCVLPRSGTYEVVLRLNQDARQDSGQASATVGSLEVVLDGPAPRAYRLAVDPAQVTSLLEQLQAREAAEARQRAERQGNGPPRAGR